MLCFLSNKKLLYQLKDVLLMGMQKLAKIRIYFIRNVCNQIIFDGQQFMYNRSLKKLLNKFVVHIFTLHMVPFAFKLVNYWGTASL